MEKHLEANSTNKSSILPLGSFNGKNLTVENLSKRHIILMSWCCMCQGDRETVDRLLLHCPIAKELREKVYVL